MASSPEQVGGSIVRVVGDTKDIRMGGRTHVAEVIAVDHGTVHWKCTECEATWTTKQLTEGN